MKRILAGVFAISLIIPNQTFASEKDNFEDLELPAGAVDLNILPTEFQDVLSKRSQEINDYFNYMEKLRIEAKLATTENLGNSISKAQIRSINEELEYYENNSASIVGLEKLSEIDGKPLVQPSSNNTQATVKEPTVYYDNDTASYVASSGWNWTTINGDNNNGSWDGFGLRVNQEVVSVLEEHLTLFDYYGNKYSTTQGKNKYSLPEKYGYTQEFDDVAVYRDYHGHSGTSWMFFRFYNGKPVGKTVNLNATYWHTWDSTSINNFGVSITGFTGTFSVVSKGWKTNNFAAIKF